LGKSFLKLDKTYISLKAQGSLQIKNQSKFKVDFEWRAFKSEVEEKEKKDELFVQLEQEEAEERMLLKEAILQDTDDNDNLSEDEDTDEGDEKQKVLKRQKKAELLLARKYRIITKAI